jgi:hypothetical protein
VNLKKATALIIAFCLAGAPALAHVRHHHHRLHHRLTHHVVAAPKSQGVTVWVNTISGVYHYAGERWYGATEEGEYLPEKRAIADGYRARENGQ